MNLIDMEKELEDIREMVLHIRGELYSVKELLDKQIMRCKNGKDKL